MAIIMSEARRDVVRLIERVTLDRSEVEIMSKRGSAVLMSRMSTTCWRKQATC